MWCHCRMVYLPMSYLYGKRFVGPITPTILSLRKELYTVPYHDIDWDRARNLCAKVSEAAKLGLWISYTIVSLEFLILRPTIEYPWSTHTNHFIESSIRTLPPSLWLLFLWNHMSGFLVIWCRKLPEHYSYAITTTKSCHNNGHHDVTIHPTLLSLHKQLVAMNSILSQCQPYPYDKLCSLCNALV